MKFNVTGWAVITVLSLSSCMNPMRHEIGEGSIDEVKEAVFNTADWELKKQAYIYKNLDIEYRLARLAREAELKKIHLPRYEERALVLAKEFDAMQSGQARYTDNESELLNLSLRDSLPASKWNKEKG